MLSHKLGGVVFVFSVIFSLVAFDPATVELKPSVPYTVREGLPNFAAKLKAGKPVNIAYFGGSITNQKGWRPQTLEFIQKSFPKVDIKHINAAIGGTDSTLGAFRLRHDVLQHKPDLILIEFAVNDHGGRVIEIRRAIEGIIRQIRRELPGTDICFVYTITISNIKDYQDGKLPRSASVSEEIAEHYGIPSVNFGYEVAKLEAEGKLVMKTNDVGLARVSGDELNENAALLNSNGKIPFAKDGVHPLLNTGHVIYTRQFIGAFPALIATGKPGKRQLPEPMLKDCLENVQTVAFGSLGIKITGPAVKLPDNSELFKQFFHRLPELWKFEPEASIEFQFKGSRVAIYDLLGPGSGCSEVSVDGKTYERRRFDAYCVNWRLALCPVFMGRDGIHNVKIRITGKELNKRAILFERNRGDFDKTPDKYRSLDWYAGCVFIVGELVQ